jgi:hypothetical protein
MSLRRYTAVLATLLPAGCGGAAFSAGLIDGRDGGQLDAQAADDASQPGQDAPSNVDGSGIPEEGSDALDASVDAPPEHPEAGRDASVACVCPGAVSCWYSIDEPSPVGGSSAGPLRPVNTVVLTHAVPTSAWSEMIWTPPVNDYDWTWTDVDVSRFVNGGTITVSGVLGATGSTGTAILTAECPASVGAGPYWLENEPNVIPGSAWTFPGYAFPAGTTVLHVGAQGSGASTAGTTNNMTITTSVQ